MMSTFKILGLIVATILGAIILLALVSVSFDLYNKYYLRTPHKILERQFEINLNDFDYTVKSFHERRLPNGDGDCEIIFQFTELNPSNMCYLRSKNIKPLPIPDTLKHNISAPAHGYYLYDTLPGGYPNYKIFVVDTDNNTATLRYERYW